MTNKLPTREELNEELKEAIADEYFRTMSGTYAQNLWEKYQEAIEAKESEFAISGAHPSESLVCDLDNKILTYRSGYAEEDTHLHEFRTNLIDKGMLRFLLDSLKNERWCRGL